MISDKLQKAINEQIVAEMWSANLYLSMSFYLQREGYDGEHECQVSKLIENVVKVASEEKDMASQDFLWGYVREQVEEEATAQGILEKIRKADKAALLFIDDKLGQRV